MAHSVQFTARLCENCPGTQSWQCAMPILWAYWPEGQLVQLSAPTEDAYVPSLHGAQVSARVPLKRPGSQSSHSVAWPSENCPGAHAEQTVDATRMPSVENPDAHIRQFPVTAWGA